MKYPMIVAAAFAATASTQALADAQEGTGWPTEVAAVFFADDDEGSPILRDREDVEADWAALPEGLQAQVRADCVAALEVGLAVDPAGTATGDVGADPEVEAVEADVRNEMETEEAVAADGNESLAATGPQREVYLEGVDADVWAALCEMVADL